jgi:predicted nucleotide-binding protein
MALPIRTVLEDINVVCGYLAKKPTGASLSEMRKVLDAKYIDGRKLSALKFWSLIDENDGRMKVTQDGRDVIGTDILRSKTLLKVISRIEPYMAVVERAAHRTEDKITAPDVAAHWHAHFKSETSESDRTLNDQAVCFFQVATGAELGQIWVGRKGAATRFEFDSEALKKFLDENPTAATSQAREDVDESQQQEESERANDLPSGQRRVESNHGALGQAIFVAHGKNKKPLEQLKRILEQFKIPFRVATDEPNLGRPIGSKVREVMESCNCAILIFTADEEFRTQRGEEIWRPSENVVFELGASGYLYGNRIVIMKEEGVDFPTNFRDLGYISFANDALDAKAMEVLRELIGFGIVKVST